eukprot:gnl/Dysnectes_brevis/2477_a2960_1294.p1 GENE.gnl/Dysnectes_brevis/2477_a2960_1294~~gnl/Dysnectes_brevis/2477_a2960_1294.p1  ORF type:complete len:276 (-),score=53.63 gnl/Dysnectes_brevis/2477_a2960_1294:151-885(-)
MTTTPYTLFQDTITVGTRVACLSTAYDDKLWYEAKVLELLVHPISGESVAKVHYQGFSSKYDEFIAIGNLKPPTPDILDKKLSPSGKQRTSLQVVLTPALQRMLAFDHHTIKTSADPPKPSSPPVKQLLKLWADESDHTRRRVYADGLLAMFDSLLHSLLLYPEEAPQATGVRRENMTDGSGEGEMRPSEYYGADHLLRLMVLLPEILASQPVPQCSFLELQSQTDILLEWLDENMDDIFDISA